MFPQPLHNSQRILIISPHTDDAELGCGASIARWAREGKEIRICHLSDTSNIHGAKRGQALRQEATSAAKQLGLESANLQFGNFPTRNFPSVRQDVLDYLLSEQSKFDPDLVIGPSVLDSHQDHAIVAQEVSRAFKDRSILNFDTYWNLVRQDSGLIVEVSESDMRKKISALGEYKSQTDRAYMDEEIVLAQSRMRGLPRGFRYGEAFSVSQLSVRL